MTTVIKNRRRLARAPSMAEQREARLQALAAKYAPDVDRDKAERAERMAGRTPEQIAARRKAAVIEELERNGIKVPSEPTTGRITDPVVQQYRVEEVKAKRSADCWEPIIVRPAARDFVSRPDAKPMQPGDIANVQVIDNTAANYILEVARGINPSLLAELEVRIDREWQRLLSAGERLTLTAYAWRKQQREELAT